MKNWYTLGARNREELALQLNRCEEFGLTVHTIIDSSRDNDQWLLTVVAWKADSRMPPLKNEKALLDVEQVYGPRPVERTTRATDEILTITREQYDQLIHEHAVQKAKDGPGTASKSHG